MPVQQLSITVAEVGERTTIVAVHGELDLAGADEFRAALETRNGWKPGRRLLVDLARATFIDSTALGILSGASRSLKSGGGSLTVVASDPRIVRIFELAGLNRLIRVERSLAEAVASVLPPAA
ncbi:MAG: anti-sigma factor antagonist [Gaiellaceae bacterium]